MNKMVDISATGKLLKGCRDRSVFPEITMEVDRPVILEVDLLAQEYILQFLTTKKSPQSAVVVATFIPHRIKNNLGRRKQCMGTFWSTRHL